LPGLPRSELEFGISSEPSSPISCETARDSRHGPSLRACSVSFCCSLCASSAPDTDRRPHGRRTPTRLAQDRPSCRAAAKRRGGPIPTARRHGRSDGICFPCTRGRQSSPRKSLQRITKVAVSGVWRPLSDLLRRSSRHQPIGSFDPKLTSRQLGEALGATSAVRS
jgi:hypothetical protein